MVRRLAVMSLLIFLFALSSLLLAQDATPQPVPGDPTPEPTVNPDAGREIELTAEDGKILYGSYFARSDGDGRAVLLLHQMYADRSGWTPLIYPLLDAGFKVLAVDLRGHGQTRGRLSWTAAQDDTLAWAAWLKTQPGVNSVAVVGSSIGSSLALAGCAGIEGCVGAVAISPGLNYYGVKVSDAVQSGMASLVIYAEDDRYPKVDVPKMQALEGSNLQVLLYPGRDHGFDLFKKHEDLVPTIVNWIAGR